MAGKIAAITILVAITFVGTGFAGAWANDSPTSPIPLAPKDQAGNTLSSLSTGQMVILSTNVVNTHSEPEKFTAIIEVRDAKGVTLFLGWQSGTLTLMATQKSGCHGLPSKPAPTSSGHSLFLDSKTLRY